MTLLARMLVTIGIAISFAGCTAARRRDSASVPTIPSTQAALVIPWDRIYYQAYSSPQLLTGPHRDEIVRYLAEVMPGDADIWFLWVRYSSESHFTADVFLKPHQIAGRFREGRCVRVHSGTLRTLWAMARVPNLESYLREAKQLDRYVQVVATPYAFNPEIPSSTEMPFSMDHDLPSPQVIAIIDLARKTLRSSRATPLRDADAPVLWIGNEKDGSYTVHFGWWGGMLYAHGQSVRVRRTTNGFEPIDGVGSWVS